MIALGCDTAGLPLMEALRKHLQDNALQFIEFSECLDYPVAAALVAQAILDGSAEFGLLICGTGIGISIAANRFHGIRAALCSDCYSAEMTRRHNNANILALGARVIAPGLAAKILDTFLSTQFEAGRHKRRIDLIETLATKGESLPCPNTEQDTCQTLTKTKDWQESLSAQL